MSKQDVKDFADRLKGELAKTYNLYRDQQDEWKGESVRMEAYWEGRADETRMVMQKVDKLQEEV